MLFNLTYPKHLHPVFNIKSIQEGIRRWFCDEDSELLPQGARVPCLVGKLRASMLQGEARKGTKEISRSLC